MAYVKFQLKDGSTVYIESVDTPRGASGLIPPGKTDHVEPANVPFSQAVESISKMAVEMMEGLRSGFDEQPSELSINFGLKASADLGSLFLSRGGMEANFNVALRWHKKGAEGDNEDTQKADKDEADAKKSKTKE